MFRPISQLKEIKLGHYRRHTATPRAGDPFWDLVATAKRLQAPGGCPWDRTQTVSSLLPYLIEETWEVFEAARSHGAPRAEPVGPSDPPVGRNPERAHGRRPWCESKDRHEDLREELGDVLLYRALSHTGGRAPRVVRPLLGAQGHAREDDPAPPACVRSEENVEPSGGVPALARE